MEQGVLAEVLEKERLSAREQKRLVELEHIIVAELGSFLRVGAALAEINANRLYREDAWTFEEYLALKWDMGRARGYQLVDAHKIVESLSTSCRQTDSLPTNEAQLRPLVKYKNDPEMLNNVWSKAVDKAAGKITAKVVQRTIYEVTGEKVGRKAREVRAGVRKASASGTVSPEFAKAFEIIIKEIEKARNSGYKTSSREEMVRRFDTLRHVLSEDGKKIVDKIG